MRVTCHGRQLLRLTDISNAMSYERDRTRFFSDRLRWEWNGIVWRHADKLGLHGMREPVFSINREMNELGRWYPFPKSMIELKESLVLGHPWYAVSEVLRHEIAHQVTDYLNPHLDEPSHVPAPENCEAMGVNPSAKISYGATLTSVCFQMMANLPSLLRCCGYGSFWRCRRAQMSMKRDWRCKIP